MPGRAGTPLVAGRDPDEAVRFAAELTVLCVSVIYGRPALLAVGRRVFSTPIGGGR